MDWVNQVRRFIMKKVQNTVVLFLGYEVEEQKGLHKQLNGQRRNYEDFVMVHPIKVVRLR